MSVSPTHDLTMQGRDLLVETLGRGGMTSNLALAVIETPESAQNIVEAIKTELQGKHRLVPVKA